MTTLFDAVPLPLTVRGYHGYWGASPYLAGLTGALIRALAAGESTKWVINEISGELLNERAPTPDEWDFDEDAVWAGQLERQQLLWEERGELYAEENAP